MSNDRYGVLTDIAHPPAQPAPAQTTTPASEVETVIEEASAPRKFAAHLQMKSLPESLQNPPSLTAASVYNFSETMLGMGLDEVSRDLIRAAHGDKVQYRAIGTPYYWCEVFFNTRMSELAETFFQSDVKALYRSVKMITQEVTALEDAVFLSQFDLWITQHTNDWLNRHNGDLHIDSFSQDFEDLVMALRRQTLDHDERLMEHLRQTLGKAASDVHALQNSPSPERTDEQKERDALTMYLPHHGFMVFVRATSTALGDDGSSKGLEKMQKVMKSLRQCIGNKVKFEVFTADRRMYAVSFDLHDNVHVTQLS